VTIVTSFPTAKAAFALCVKQATRFIADCLRSAPLCYKLRTELVSAV
jgi:hypothetical protein